jgi:hypothetical protein
MDEAANEQIVQLYRVIHAKKVEEVKRCFEHECAQRRAHIENLKDAVAASDLQLEDAVETASREACIGKIKDQWIGRHQEFARMLKQIEEHKKALCQSFARESLMAKYHLKQHLSKGCSAIGPLHDVGMELELASILDRLRQGPSGKKTSLAQDNRLLLEILVDARMKASLLGRLSLLERENKILTNVSELLSSAKKDPSSARNTVVHFDRLLLELIQIMKKCYGEVN